MHQIGKSSASALAISGGSDVRQVLRNEQRPSKRQEAQKKADCVHPCSTRLPRAKVSLPEISERGRSKRRGRRLVALRDPSQNVVPEQKVNILQNLNKSIVLMFENILKPSKKCNSYISAPFDEQNSDN